MANGIEVQVSGVKLDTFVSKKGVQYYTFQVPEPVMKFVSYTNNLEKAQLDDLVENGEFVDLKLVLKGDRLYFLSASPSQ